LTDSDNDGLLDNEEAWMQTYAAEAAPFAWEDIEVPGNAVTNWLNENFNGYALVPLGFDFEFYNSMFNDVYISRCGFLRFGASSTDYGNDDLPDTSEPSNLVAIFWDTLDMDDNTNAVVYSATLGTAPDRRAVITWKGFPHYSDKSARLTFQVELQEQGDIIYRYLDMQDGTENYATGRSATAGMQDATERDGTTWAHNTIGSLTNGLAIRFHYAPVFHQTTDPTNWDTDGDGIDDGFEDGESSLDPLDPFDGAEDRDGDGLNNALEYQIGTNLRDADTDGDDLSDWGEYTYGLNPTHALPSDMVPDSDGDGMTNGYEVANYLDSFDAADKHLDRDHDGLDNYWEYTNGLSASQWDTDGDTIPDGIEVEWGTSPTIADDLLSDNDGDGLNLGEEYNHGTDPSNADSDGDGTNDGAEVGQGGSPNNDSDGGTPPETSDIVEMKLILWR
jgi:hypothetical protein